MGGGQSHKTRVVGITAVTQVAGSTGILAEKESIQFRRHSWATICKKTAALLGLSPPLFRRLFYENSGELGFRG
ncbi:hypothetical protein M569_14663 [Genlisea aurea]|uniref:Uncharacterized protein n=1 Tax=Genlisea aurea TaxID=192259 RepID=S8DBM5_9LAMI|nr:hypothetical protein M569_14663 [Genlisea aurea]